MNGVRGLSAQQVGVYMMLLCRIYEEDGTIEYHELRLATYCGMRQNTFKKTVEQLIELDKFQLVDGRLNNRRAETEISSRADNLKKKSKAGKASAQKTQQKQGPPSTPVEQVFNDTDTDTDTDITTLPARESGPPGNGNLSPNQLHTKLMEALGRAATRTVPSQLDQIWLVESWVEKGWDLESLILPAIRDRCADAPPGCIHSWKFFEPIIAQRKAAIDKPLPKMEATNGTSSFPNSRSTGGASRSPRELLRSALNEQSPQGNVVDITPQKVN